MRSSQPFALRLLLSLLPILLLAVAPSATTTGSGGLTTKTIASVHSATTPTPTAIGDDGPGALQTVGGTAPELANATTRNWRSLAGSLLAAETSAWQTLTRSERRILLDGDVEWAAYDDLLAADPELANLTFPILYFAADLRPNDRIRTDDVRLNRVVLALPAAKLGPALAAGAKQAVAVGPDLIILVDDVVVGQIAGGATPDTDVSSGTVDHLGRIVLDEESSSVNVGAPIPTIPPDQALPPPRVSASGEAIARVRLAALPPEALDTIALIQAGGPFPFERDGVTFGNYEERLPATPFGYYREYTVITPGLDHRGARRIVTGNDGAELYYTDDHYESFVEVLLPDD